MLKELIEKQRVATNHFFDAFQVKDVEPFFDRLTKVEGIIFLTGIGKSGLIAKKIAVTMTSTGTRALYMPAVDAVHGDLGMVSSSDLFLFFSKSGESDELLHLVAAVKNKGAHTVAIVCHKGSRLARRCDSFLVLPFYEELCPFNMAPTTSTTCQLLFGDLIAVALMQKRNFSLDQYALNHPSGQIGKRITLRVKDLMLTGEKVPLCRPTDTVQDLLVELTNKRCGCVIVTHEDQTVAGIFTDGDLRRSLQSHRGELLPLQIGELMSKSVMSVTPDTMAWDALKIMEADPVKRIAVLPVVTESGKVVGLIHLHDIVQSGLVSVHETKEIS